MGVKVWRVIKKRRGERKMAIEERLENMEKQLGRLKRRNRWLLGAILFLAGGLIVLAVVKTTVPQGTVKELRAKRIALEDENGIVRVSLMGDSEMSGMWLFNDKGESRASLSVDKYGPRLSLTGGKNMPSALLGANDSTSGLSLWDEKEDTLVSMSVNKNGPGLSLTYKSGKAGVWLYATDIGPGLNLNDYNGESRASLGVNKLGPTLTLKDEKGMPRLRAGRAELTAPDGKTFGYPESSLILFGTDGKVIWSAIK
jgi:hypothetical protein